MSERPEIDVQRRRKGEKPAQRATAPVRRPSGQSGGSYLVGFLVNDLDSNVAQFV